MGVEIPATRVRQGIDAIDVIGKTAIITNATTSPVKQDHQRKKGKGNSSLAFKSLKLEQKPRLTYKVAKDSPDPQEKLNHTFTTQQGNHYQ